MNAQANLGTARERAEEMRFIVVDMPDWTRGSRCADIAAAELSRRSKRIRDMLRENRIGTSPAHDMIRMWTAIYFWMSGDPEARDEYAAMLAKGGHAAMLAELTRARDVAMKNLEQSWFDRAARPKLETRARALNFLQARATAMLADGTPEAEIEACAGLRGEG